MLKQLIIDNIALIDHVELEFRKGLTVLSGETGSGKSIIVDSLAFVLGDRADKTLIKYGTDAAEVSAIFEVEQNSPVLIKLAEYGYGDDTEILIYRKMSVSGKNEIRIQGKTATLSILKEICAELVDIFGQGQHLALLSEKNQMSVLDAFCNCHEVAHQMQFEVYPLLTEVIKNLKSLGGDELERARLLDILKYQIDEITAIDPSEKEEVELQTIHKRMVNAERISAALGQAIDCLNGENGAINLLAQSQNMLRSISNLEDRSEDLAGRLNSVRLEADDVASQIQEILCSAEFTPSDADRVEDRLEKYRQLKRKYGGDIVSVLQFLHDARTKYESLANAAEIIEELSEQKTKLIFQLYKLALLKSDERKKTARSLSQSIMHELDDLGMRGTKFCVQFNDVPTLLQFSESPSADGFDKVEFLMSANVGEPLKPLSKVISGGEMSRFMLAVKNITAMAEKIPTMIFDEIDAGISGNMAQMVANKLANVSAQENGYQCIVITHLPQIAAMADYNLYIKKYQKEGKTFTAVELLVDRDQRAVEVARLMGGVGEHAIVGAKELLDWSDNYKRNRS